MMFNLEKLFELNQWIIVAICLVLFGSAFGQEQARPVPPPSDKCICDVRFVGEYCGLTLNERNMANNCSSEMFFCGKSNMHKPAVILKTCPQRGFECNKKLNGGNACYQKVKCQCGTNLSRKHKYCGTELTGPDCQANIIYRCPMIRRYNPSPEDGCPNGCKDGRCL